ncbi:choice-of-anchor P family protein [Promicromonospora panici]|uniref:choice-of-anchor P family protein n=1 Tax=Promicromonospora panici TaxID=2219658 RepID=UPI00101C54E2|nr:choice-of-anchor P family protein [Promicromonospora panici]
MRLQRPRSYRPASAVLAVVLACTTLVGLSSPAGAAPSSETTPPDAGERALIAEAESEGPQSVIVEVAKLGDQRRVVGEMRATGHEVRVTDVFDRFPLATITADADTIRELAESPDVVRVHPNGTRKPELNTSIPLIGADDLHQRGITGTGQTVVILDSGIDADHEFFGGRVDEACFSGGVAESLCPNGERTQTGDGSAQCDQEFCDHGTHVAGIAAGADVGNAPGNGVAPSADIVAIQVFSRSDDCGDDPAPCVTLSDTDAVAALEYVLDLAENRSIAAVNMSFGGGTESEACTDSVYVQPMRDLLEAGIAPVASAGNRADDGSSSPGCEPEAITVGASDDDDTVRDTSNRGELLDVFAPGGDVRSSLPSDSDDGYGVSSGTSMAAPHVTGAFALLREELPGASVDELEQLLEDTGEPITYESGGADVTTPRIDLAAALPREGSGLTYTGPTSAALAQTFTASATLTSGGNPLAGETVSFSLGSGGGSQECSGTTDASGEASCSLTPTDSPGETTITAEFAGNRDVEPATDTVPFTIGRQPTVVTYTGPAEADFNDAFTASATLTAGGSPVSGQTVSFSLGSGGGSQECSGTTNGSGVASCSLTPSDAPGETTIDVSFAGTGTLEPSSDSASFTITRQETALRYTGPERVANGTAVELSGMLTEETTDGPGVSGRDVTLALGAGADRQECTGTTGSSGAVACTIPVVDQPLNADATVPVSLDFAGDTYYEPSTASATVLLEYYTGRAFGLSADVPLPLVGFEIEPTPDTGEIRTADASSTDTPCLTELDLLLLQANALCPDVTTSLAPGTSVATASVDEVRIGIPGLPVIEVENATAQATSTCAGDGAATGTTDMTLRVGGEAIEIGTEPNTVVELPGVARIVVNEQVADPDADHGLTVRALHLTALEGGLTDVVVASATSGVHNCAS